MVPLTKTRIESTALMRKSFANVPASSDPRRQYCWNCQPLDRRTTSLIEFPPPDHSVREHLIRYGPIREHIYAFVVARSAAHGWVERPTTYPLVAISQ